MLHILAFESFDAGSHRAVRQSIERHSMHQWTWLTRPGRAWKWRMRTAAIEMVYDLSQLPIKPDQIDAIFVTSLMSASDLRALLPAGLRNTPLVLYMHENQAAYPSGEQGDDPRDAHFVLTNLLSAAAADLVVFNSNWNRTSLLAGAGTLLKHARDGKLQHLLPMIEAKSCVLWPPVEPPPETLETTRTNRPDAPTTVVWPHRWEHDKGPEHLLATARQYSESHNLRWIILGEQYEDIPESMQIFKRECVARIDHIGYVESRQQYWQWLARADWVLSTAHHEFFGIAVVESMLAGALPWLPDRLSYPELLPDQAHGLNPMNPPADREAMILAIRQHLDPACASKAVARLDTAIEECVSAQTPQ